MSFSPDGKKYLYRVWGKGGRVRYRNRKATLLRRRRSGRWFTADGKKLFVMSDKILECDPDTGKAAKTYDRPKTKWMWHRIAARRTASGSSRHFGMFAGAYDTATGAETTKLDERFEMAGYILGPSGQQLLWAPDGKQVFASGVLLNGSGMMGAAVWNAETAKRTQSFEPDTSGEGPRAGAFSSDGKQLAIAYRKRIDIWSDGEKKPARLGEQGLVTALRVPPRRQAIRRRDAAANAPRRGRWPCTSAHRRIQDTGAIDRYRHG